MSYDAAPGLSSGLLSLITASNTMSTVPLGNQFAATRELLQGNLTQVELGTPPGMTVLRNPWAPALARGAQIPFAIGPSMDAAKSHYAQVVRPIVLHACSNHFAGVLKLLADDKTKAQEVVQDSGFNPDNLLALARAGVLPREELLKFIDLVTTRPGGLAIRERLKTRAVVKKLGPVVDAIRGLDFPNVASALDMIHPEHRAYMFGNQRDVIALSVRGAFDLFGLADTPRQMLLIGRPDQGTDARLIARRSLSVEQTKFLDGEKLIAEVTVATTVDGGVTVIPWRPLSDEEILTIQGLLGNDISFSNIVPGQTKPRESVPAIRGEAPVVISRYSRHGRLIPEQPYSFVLLSCDSYTMEDFSYWELLALRVLGNQRQPPPVKRSEGVTKSREATGILILRGDSTVDIYTPDDSNMVAVIGFQKLLGNGAHLNKLPADGSMPR